MINTTDLRYERSAWLTLRDSRLIFKWLASASALSLKKFRMRIFNLCLYKSIIFSAKTTQECYLIMLFNELTEICLNIPMWFLEIININILIYVILFLSILYLAELYKKYIQRFLLKFCKKKKTSDVCYKWKNNHRKTAMSHASLEELHFVKYLYD